DQEWGGNRRERIEQAQSDDEEPRGARQSFAAHSSPSLDGTARGVADGTRTRDHRDHNPGLYQLSYRHRARDRIPPTAQCLQSVMTAWVWVVRATRRPEASSTSVSTTIVVLPTWSGCARAVTFPSRTAPRKLVFDSIVTVRASAGRFRNAHTAPAVSARVMSTPPCSAPPAVQRSGENSSVASTSSASPNVLMPSVAPNGICPLTCWVISGFSGVIAGGFVDVAASGPYASPVHVVERKEMNMKVARLISLRLDAISL